MPKNSFVGSFKYRRVDVEAVLWFAREVRMLRVAARTASGTDAP